MRGSTSFVVAQRISTVLNADKIIVLDRRPDRGRGHAHRIDAEPARFTRKFSISAWEWVQCGYERRRRVQA